MRFDYMMTTLNTHVCTCVQNVLRPFPTTNIDSTGKTEQKRVGKTDGETDRQTKNIIHHDNCIPSENMHYK